MVKRSPGSIVLGGTRLSGISPLDGFDLSKGSFFSPTIITDVDTSDELWQEEVFGPVVVVKSFSVGSIHLYAQNNSLSDPLHKDRRRRDFTRE